MRFRTLLLALIAFAAVSHAAHAQACNRPAITKAADAVASARKALNKFKLPNMETDVSPVQSAAVTVLKNRLGALMAAYMTCAPAPITTATIESDLTRLMHGASVEEPSLWGQNLTITAKRARLLILQSSFNIPCATDEVTSVFEPAGGGWREAIRVQFPPHHDVSGATGGLSIDLSPPDEAGRWYAVTTSIAPWCSSTWSHIRYQVLRPSGNPVKPKVLFAGDDTIWWGADDYGRLQLTVRDMDLRFHSSSIDGGVHNREWVRHFQIAGDRATRTPPYANTPRDFAEEWIQSDWKTVAPWTASFTLQKRHDAMHENPYFEYVSVRRCRSGATQIELTNTDETAKTYLQVQGTTRLLKVEDKPDRACDGPNQYK